MKTYEATEQAYKNGYDKGYADGKRDAVKKGEWIHDAVEGFSPFTDELPIWIDVMQCSVCKEYIEGSHGTNYCPNCGAKMDLED